MKEVFWDSFVDDAFRNTPQQSEKILRCAFLFMFLCEIDAYALTRVTSQFKTHNYC